MHFTVGVILDGYTEETLREKLMPFHQFECTGINEHIQDFDITEEVMKEYHTSESNYAKAPDGTLYNRYDSIFYQPATEEEIALIESKNTSGLCFSTTYQGGPPSYRVHHYPEGYTEVTVLDKDLKTFEEFVDYCHGYKLAEGEPDIEGDHKFGYITKNEDGSYKVIQRTNPNYQWDWYSVGGRWDGLLQTQSGNKTDIAKIKDIDWDGYLTRQIEERNKVWDEYELKLKALEPVQSDDIDMMVGRLEEIPADQAQAEREKLLTDVKVFRWLSKIAENDTRETYIAKVEGLCTYAVLDIEGNWHESSGEESDNFHKDYYKNFIQPANPEHYLVIVDCHI